MYFLARGFRDRRYWRHFGERLGFLPDEYRQAAHGAIWVHAVSVGEVLSSVELLRRLRAEFPAAPLFVSSTTVAGRAAAADKLPEIADGVFYAPVDYCFAVRRVLRTLRPRAVVVLETEIWPNLYREAKRTGAALVIVNGRISDRAAPRYRALAWFFRQVLALPDAILAQSEISRARFLELGAPADKVRLTGNLKYDFSPRGNPPEAVRELIERLRPAEVWIAASTMPPAQPGDPDEDEVVLEAFRALAPAHPRLLLILAPRKPERFEGAAERLRRAGLPFLRRSALPATEPLAPPGVLLLDTIGELSSLFGLADVVFMGGTLPHRGGHNVLEPAFFGCAIIAGPHMENFPEIARKFTEAGALVRIESAGELAPAVDALLRDANRRAELGARARAAAESERGATERALGEIRERYWMAAPHCRRPAPALLWTLSRLWLLGGRIKRRRDLARRSRLETPVISVGGLTVGGTGKTPVVLWLARRLSEAGFRPAILTRGYRRRAAEKLTILAPGERAPVARTGDEAQIYLRAGVGPVGIGADRAAAGRVIEQRFHPDVLLLDDGFQHFRLERTVDLVVIDALDPFGGEEPVPLGRLREPLAALRRAHVVLVTRVEPGQRIDAIEQRIRRYNPEAPIFTSRMAPQAWEPCAAAPRVAAFCGLGNPASFRQTLAGAGVQPVFCRAFADHHRYTRTELADLAAGAKARGADALVTTEKDFANLPDGWADAVQPLSLHWLRIGVEVDRAEELLARLSRSSRNSLRSSPPP